MQTIYRVSIIFERLKDPHVAQYILDEAIGYSTVTIKDVINGVAESCYILTVEFSNATIGQSFEDDITQRLEEKEIWWGYYYT